MSGTSALMLTNRGYPTPDVSAIFAKDVYDWTTVSTLSSMPSGGSISRAGNAMLYDSTGKLTYAPNNLLLNTATLSTQSVTTAAINYILSFSGTGSVALSGAYTGNLAGTGASNRVSLAFTSTAASLTITVTGSVTSAQLEAVTYQTTPSTYVATTSAAYYGPRFDYDPSTLAAKGLLIEGTRTNLVLQSSALTNAAWTAYQAAFTTDATLDPTGVAAQKLTATSGTTRQPQVYSTATVAITSGSQYTLSCYVKAGTLNYAAITLYGNVTGHWVSAVFDLSTSATTTASQTAVGGTSGTLYSTFKQNVGNGWYRVGIVGAVSQSAAMTIIELAPAATGNTFAVSTGSINFGTAAGTENIYISAPQLELGSFVTSYIPTVASSVARAAETFSITGYTNRLLEAYYIDQQTNVSSSLPETVVSSGAVTISPPTFGWVTSVRTYTNAYAGSIASPSWLSFSRSGNAMMTDSTGKLTWAPANQLTYSNGFDTIAAWPVQGYKAFGSGSTVNATTAPDGTTTAANLVCSTSTTQIGPYQISAVLASTYIMSIYVKANTGVRYLQLSYPATQPSTDYANFDLNTGTITAGTYAGAAMQSVGNGWYRISMTSNTAANANGGIWLTFISTATAARAATYAGNGTDAVYIWGAQLERVTYQTQPSAYIPTTTAAVYGPRYDFDASTVPATPRGLLIEESRANLLTYSETLGIFTAENATNVSSAITGPNGVASSARKIVESATSAIHGMYAGFTAANSMYTGSIYLKAGERSQVMVFLYDITTPAQYPVTVNLITGTIVGTNTAPYKIENVGNGWFRVSITSTNPLSAGSSRLWVRMYDNAGNATYLGDGASGFYAWGYQVEAGSFATSYIPTTSASVTRAADVAQLTGSALTTLQGSAFSYLVETSLYSTSNSPIVFGVGTAASPIYATGNTSANSYDSASTPTQTGAAFAGSGSFITTMRAGFSTNTSGRSLVLNNGTVASASGALGTARTAVAISGYTNATQMANGYFRSLALYNQRLPDAILKQKSSVNAPY